MNRPLPILAIMAILISITGDPGTPTSLTLLSCRRLVHVVGFVQPLQVFIRINLFCFSVRRILRRRSSTGFSFVGKGTSQSYARQHTKNGKQNQPSKPANHLKAPESFRGTCQAGKPDLLYVTVSRLISDGTFV